MHTLWICTPLADDLIRLGQYQLRIQIQSSFIADEIIILMLFVGLLRGQQKQTSTYTGQWGEQSDLG